MKDDSPSWNIISMCTYILYVCIKSLNIGNITTFNDFILAFQIFLANESSHIALKNLVMPYAAAGLAWNLWRGS